MTRAEPTKAQLKLAEDALQLTERDEIAAIKLLREYSDMSLREASDAVKHLLNYDRRVKKLCDEACRRLAGEG